MNSYKSARVSEDIKRQLSLIARELKDPRVKDKMLSFVRVEVTNDLSFAKIYVSAMEGIEIAKEAVRCLNELIANGKTEGNTKIPVSFQEGSTTKTLVTEEK